MLLQSLYMKNFKRFREQAIQFHDGITGIVGKNGAGKSTIVEAVLFGLYGVRGLGKNAGEFIVSASAGPREKCEVRLDFTTGGENYTVTRAFRKMKTSTQHDARLFINGSLLADGVIGVETEIQRVIGMGPDDFRNTIFAGQKDLLSLIDETPGERRNWFMRVLGLDALKKDADLALKTEIQEKGDELRAYEIRLQELDLDEIRSRQKASTDEMEELKAEITAYEQKKTDILKQKHDLAEKRSALVNKKDRFIALNEQLKAREESITQLNTELNRIEDEHRQLCLFEQDYRKLAAEGEKYSGLKNKFEDLVRRKSRFESFNAKLSECNSIIAHIEDEKAVLDEQLAALAKDRETLCALESRMQERSALLKKLEEMKAVEPHYYEIRQEQAHVLKRCGEIEGQARVLQEEIGKLDSRIKDLTDSEELDQEIHRAEERRSALISRASAIAEQRRKNRIDADELAGQLGTIQSAGEDGICPTCHRPLGDHYEMIIAEFASKLKDLENLENSLKTELQRIEDEKIQSENRLAVQREELGKIAELKAALSRCRNERRALMVEAEQYLTRRDENERNLAQLEFSPERKQETEAEIKRYERDWKVYLETQERVRATETKKSRLGMLSKNLDHHYEVREQLSSEITGTGFNPDEYAAVETEYAAAETAHQRLLELKARLERLPALEREISDKKDACAAVKSSIEEIRGTMREIEFSEEELAGVEDELTKCGSHYDELMQSLAMLKAGEQRLSEKQETLRRELEMAAGYSASCKDLREEIVMLKKTREVMNDYFLYLLTVVRGQIEGEVGRVLGEITDGRYDTVLVDDDFTVFVNDIGGDYPAHRFSGGEQDVIAIALRIALSRYLAEMHQIHDSTFLIFDEIFGSQDEERRNNLIQALRTQETHFPQIFLISHVSDIQGEFATTLLVDMNDNNESRVLQELME